MVILFLRNGDRAHAAFCGAGAYETPSDKLYLPAGP